MESWRDKLRREAGEIDEAIRAALRHDDDDKALLVELERIADKPQFTAMTWLWAPAIAARDRVRFRPFILTHFSREAVDRNGRAFDPWTGETAAPLQRWLDAVDAADDIELTKRLFTWKLERGGGMEAAWRAEVVRRFTAAATPAARHTALAKIDGRDLTLDAASALALWELDRLAAQPFILAHLPWQAERASWQPLLARSRAVDAKFHFELYRRLVDEAQWRADVLALPVAPGIAAELERRHPALYWLTGAAEVFHALLEKHGEPAIPYVARHADKVSQRHTWRGTAEGKGLPELLALANARSWIALWGTLLRTSASRELFDREVARLVAAGARDRLAQLPGRGAETHVAGMSFAAVHALTDATACALYARFPDLLRGAYRLHVAPGWAEAFPKLAAAAIAAGDDDLVDYLASRVAHQHVQSATTEALAAHYEQLPEAAFVRRAATALSRMPPHAIWSYDALLERNALARLLFERSTTLYLADSAAVRDLLESPQIHVQALAFRILGARDPRAIALAAAHVDLLQAALLRRLHRRTRLLAFGALRNAARHDEATARYLLGRMRDALGLPEKRYPREELVGLVGEVLHRWPALRGPREQPRIYGAAP